MIHTMGAAGAVGLLGCGDDGDADGSGTEANTSSGDPSTSTSTSASTTTVSSADGSSSSPDESSDGSSDSADGSSDTGGCAKLDGWATGGTASMCGNYPDPFAGGLGETCELTCASTLGPCYAETIERQDISEGANGLPMRLALKVVDTDCNPIAGAEVDVWHTSADGFYSGEDSVQQCTLGDPEAIASRWMRGVQVTDKDGRVDFDTCFPGWYGGRTIHIHFQIRIGGTEYVTSQLFFDDAMSDEIIASEPVYSDRGPRDTTNADDGVIGGGDVDNVLLMAERQSDGAMLAWRALVIRTSTGDPLCQL
jgi:protocatechuate 3,4-dioxygenase beta subunit